MQRSYQKESWPLKQITVKRGNWSCISREQQDNSKPTKRNVGGNGHLVTGLDLPSIESIWAYLTKEPFQKHIIITLFSIFHIAHLCYHQ